MWVGLASAAVLSLIWLGLGILPKNEETTVVADRGALAQVVAEVRSTNERLSRLESEIAALRRTDDTDRDAKADLLRRIELIEQAFGPATGSIGPAPATTGSIFSSPSLNAPSGSPPLAAIRQNQQIRAPITPQTRQRAVSILPEVARLPGRAEPPAPFGQSPTSPSTNDSVLPAYSFAVDLGGFADLAELKRYWSSIVTENPLILGGLSPRQITRLEADGVRSYRLIAGPVEDVGTSRRLCEALQLRGANCTQTIHSGEPI
ncbi:MAG: hypothetical protein HKN60_09645 [Rhizobiales bacterium]|nr:hypothetical protein [Hyphomicrobiales bacterium]